ncbi:PREDICTED: uncharacterized protein LOC104809262 [Tarenaya hassleriana]|uniref:uncharacterized protein LOC104809262 n=1 Tax=Tarenaya hassleriana TaxID=28532 RepID=UPI00053C38D6|nr:PREDICTED: uncharacterized protein LOC104809262 [Tarenaya hassleriana]
MSSSNVIFFNFETATMRCCCLRGREGSAFSDPGLWRGTSRVGSVRKNPTRRCRIFVACAADSEKNGGREHTNVGPDSDSERASGSLLSRSQTYALLKQKMDVAAKAENYEEAARIRLSLKSLEDDEPVFRLKRMLKEAILEERFEDAARYRDKLNEIAPESLLKCTSDATTLGIRVQVRSVYIEGRSQPLKGHYFFAYRIRITNNSDRPVQLLRRHWIITNTDGKTEHVRGVGVIGEQPVILPNTGFEYSSACPLTTPSGIMEGEFEMKHIDRIGAPSFNVVIAPFSLSVAGDASDIF